jgi:hypothetical protein
MIKIDQSINKLNTIESNFNYIKILLYFALYYYKE